MAAMPGVSRAASPAIVVRNSDNACLKILGHVYHSSNLPYIMYCKGMGVMKQGAVSLTNGKYTSPS
jgi:hypothetical protein